MGKNGEKKKQEEEAVQEFKFIADEQAGWEVSGGY